MVYTIERVRGISTRRRLLLHVALFVCAGIACLAIGSTTGKAWGNTPPQEEQTTEVQQEQAPEQAVRTAAKKFLVAALQDDWAGMAGCILKLDNEELESFRVIVESSRAENELQEAIAKKFDEEQQKSPSRQQRAAQVLEMADRGAVVQDGDTAKFKIPRAGIEFDLAIEDGSWKVDPRTLMRGKTPLQIKRASARIKAAAYVRKHFDQYESAEQVWEVLEFVTRKYMFAKSDESEEAKEAKEADEAKAEK